MSSAPLYEEKHLLYLIAGGDEKAFYYFYNIYQRKIYFLALKFLSNTGEAEDVVQDIFTKIWLKKEALTEIENINAYLNTLSRNHIISVLRKRTTADVFIRQLYKDVNEKNVPDNDSDILQEHLQKAMATLPPQQKKVFHLGKLEGYRYEEIAAELNISKETVKKHMIEALRRIKDYVGKITWLLLLLIIK